MFHVLFLCILASMSVSSCKLAKFGFFGKQGASSNSSPQSPANNNKQGLPTAAIEVEQMGALTQNVVINVPAIIRPTRDTIDSDNGMLENCLNNGILKARYTFNNGEAPSKVRAANDCGSLSVEKEFTQTGTVQISLEVESDEGEIASATSYIQVVSPETPVEFPLPSLSISAIPLVAQIGQNIKFTATCYMPASHVVTWNFADGSANLTGDEVNHAYTQSGQYYVKGVCESGSTVMEGGVTIVVQPSGGTSSGTSTGTTGSSNSGGGGSGGTSSNTTSGGTPNPGGGNIGGSTASTSPSKPTPKPSQNPGQNNPGQK